MPSADHLCPDRRPGEHQESDLSLCPEPALSLCNMYGNADPDPLEVVVGMSDSAMRRGPL